MDTPWQNLIPPHQLQQMTTSDHQNLIRETRPRYIYHPHCDSHFLARDKHTKYCLSQQGFGKTIRLPGDILSYILLNKYDKQWVVHLCRHLADLGKRSCCEYELGQKNAKTGNLVKFKFGVFV